MKFKIIHGVILAVATILIGAGYSYFSELQSGDHVSNFKLMDQEGSFHELYGLNNQKAALLISYSAGCPIVRLYIDKINQIVQRYKDKGVAVFFLDASLIDNKNQRQLAESIKKFNVQIPVLMDRDQRISMNLKIERTAEAVLIDTSNWNIIYRGAIDNQMSYGIQKDEATEHYLETAVNSFLSGEEIAIARTDPKGCLITYKNVKPLSNFTAKN